MPLHAAAPVAITLPSAGFSHRRCKGFPRPSRPRPRACQATCQLIPDDVPAHCRRQFVITPLVELGASLAQTAFAADSPPKTPAVAALADAGPAEAVKKEAAVTARIYDARAIGEPAAVGKDKPKVWENLMGARVVYLGEAEMVSVNEGKELEL